MTGNIKGGMSASLKKKAKPMMKKMTRIKDNVMGMMAMRRITRKVKKLRKNRQNSRNRLMRTNRM